MTHLREVHQMKKIALLVTGLLLAFTLSSCAETKTDGLEAQLAETKAAMSKTGVVVSGYDTSGALVQNVHKPNTGFFVNDAVLVGDQEDIRQFDRQDSERARAIVSAFDFAAAKIDQEIRFASNVFKVIEREVEERDANTTRLNLVLSDQLGNLGRVKVKVDYLFVDGLLVEVNFPDFLLPTGDSADVCYYFPTSCLINLELNYDKEAIDTLMNTAKAKFDAKWLKTDETISNFYALMSAVEKTFNDYSSWTVVNEDATEGSIFDAESGEGVSWSSFSPTENFTKDNRFDNNFSLDHGFIRNTFFDSTDGGSNFFYASIEKATNKDEYSVINTDGAVAIVFTIKDGLLSQITDYQIAIQTFSITNTADKELLQQIVAKK